MKTGIELIAEERARQISQEGWAPEHDDEHINGELLSAARTYLTPEKDRAMSPRFVDVSIGRGLSDPEGTRRVMVQIPYLWPWDHEWWKPTPDDRVRELTKAGALIAAEIDRLNRASL